MALDFRVEYIHRENDGKLTLCIMPVVDSLDWSKTITVQGEDAQELEDKLRPIMTAAKAKYDQEVGLKNTAQQRIDALKAELGI